MPGSHLEITKSIIKGIWAPWQHLTCYLGDSEIAFTFRLNNSPFRQEVRKTSQNHVFLLCFLLDNIPPGWMFCLTSSVLQHIPGHWWNWSFPSSTNKTLKHILKFPSYDQRLSTEIQKCLNCISVLTASLTQTALAPLFELHVASTIPMIKCKSCFVGTCAPNSTMTILEKKICQSINWLTKIIVNTSNPQNMDIIAEWPRLLGRPWVSPNPSPPVGTTAHLSYIRKAPGKGPVTWRCAHLQVTVQQCRPDGEVLSRQSWGLYL